MLRLSFQRSWQSQLRQNDCWVTCWGCWGFSQICGIGRGTCWMNDDEWNISHESWGPPVLSPSQPTSHSVIPSLQVPRSDSDFPLLFCLVLRHEFSREAIEVDLRGERNKDQLVADEDIRGNSQLPSKNDVVRLREWQCATSTDDEMIPNFHIGSGSSTLRWILLNFKVWRSHFELDFFSGTQLKNETDWYEVRGDSTDFLSLDFL
jgi:hypothetical protein